MLYIAGSDTMIFLCDLSLFFVLFFLQKINIFEMYTFQNEFAINDSNGEYIAGNRWIVH